MSGLGGAGASGPGSAGKRGAGEARERGASEAGVSSSGEGRCGPRDGAGPLSLRGAGPPDAAALALVGAATFLESYANLLPSADIIAHVARQHIASIYTAWLQDPRCACWIAEHLPGGAPVGYLVATPPDLPLPGVDERDWEIRRIYVLHRFQGAGLGRGLMAQALDAARTAGKRRVLLGVYSRNAAALRFYAALGFTQAGTRSFRVGSNDYHDFILERAP